jgi:hypothetical protein
MNEQEIINSAYYLVEVDSEPWGTSDDEYLTARGLANIAINRWHKYENTTWRELMTTLEDSNVLLLGDKVATTAHVYNCPTDFVRPMSFVRIGGLIFDVIAVERIAELSDSVMNFVYFTGNPKDGFKLHINPNVTITAGETIDYEYYKKASVFTTPTSESEMADPYFIVYFIAAHMGDEGINTDYYQMAEARLEQMRAENMSGLFGVSNRIDSSFDDNLGFGN